MFDFFIDLPLWITGPEVILALVCFGVAGLMVVRRFVLPRFEMSDHRLISVAGGPVDQAISTLFDR